MGRSLISDDIKNRIRDRVDIADVIGHHVLLRRTGQNLVGLCPFHQEKSPSFSVSPSKQMFYCFGCKAGGDVFAFLTKMTGATFPEVLRELGDKVGIVVEESPAERLQRGQTHRLEEINRASMTWFQANLRDPHIGVTAREYLNRRGILHSTVESFKIGMSSPEWDGLFKFLSRKGFSHSEIVTAGLGSPRPNGTGYYDKFHGRLMFTITDLRKRVVGFGGRVLDDRMPKYLNSPDTPLFKKGQTLFAFDQAREAIVRTKTVIVVEGYFDAIALHQAGLTHTIATLGTALTAEHIQVLRRFADKVVLLFDPDAAGVRAALRGLDLFVNSGLGVKVVTLPVGEDPDTFVRREGAGAFAQLEAAAPSLLDYALNHTVKQAGDGSLESRIRSVDEMLRILQKSEHPIERQERIKIVSERLGISEARLIERYPALPAQPKRGGEASRAQRIQEIPFNAVFKRCPEERDLLVLLLRGKLTPVDVRRLHPESFTVASCRKLVEIVLAHVDRDGHISLRSALDESMADLDCGALATELSMREDHFDDIPMHIAACLDCLDRKRSEQVMRELIARLKTAEREGRVDDARLLNMQINEVRMRKAGTPTAGVVSLVKE
ncbi:MAG: DNA primase [Nitrospira sp.]|nr:DNA primase [Nitrospira sp.]MDI3464175.1 DNA primase DnaG [Nitrospira sp.]